MKFRVNPVEVEARQLTTQNLVEIEAWCHGSIKGTKLPVGDRVVDFFNQGNEIRVGVGDWVIKSADGDFSVCSNLAFEKDYEQIDEPISYPSPS